MTASVDGEVACRDGQLRITDPVNGGLPAVLIPEDDVILTVEGQVVTKPVSVWAGQSIAVRPRRSAKPARGFQIRVAPDRMAAWLSLEEYGPPGYRVRDTERAHVVRLTAEALPGRQTNPTLEEMEAALREAGVVMGLDRTAIGLALASQGAVTMRVALGFPARPGSPGRVRTVLDEQRAEDPLGIAQRVQPGQLLAEVTPADAGQSGFDVSGNRLEPAPVQSMELLAGYGAVLVEGGLAAVATVSGRPVLLRVSPTVYRAMVVPVTELSGPLAGGSDPLRFEGDVVIDGNVDGGVAIEAGGWIWVRGSVHNATLEAGQGIRVERSVKWSRLITRATRRRAAPLQHQCDQIVSDLMRMRDYAQQILGHPRYPELSEVRSLGEVVLALAEDGSGDLRDQIRRGRQAVKDLAVLRTQIDLEAILNALESRLYSGTLNSVDDLTQLIEAIAAATQRAVDILGAGGEDAPVYAHVLIGSEVDADGDVILVGPGAEQSVLRARGRVRAVNLRDVRVTSGTAIEAETAAASTRESLLLEVSPGGYIRLGLVRDETPVQVGQWSQVLAAETRNVLIQSDADGRVRAYADRVARPGELRLPRGEVQHLGTAG